MKGIRVVEVGDRIAAGACGSLLTSMGAETILIEPLTAPISHKWQNRALVAAGKRSLRAEMKDEAVLALLATADVVIASSDLAALPAYQSPPWQIVCDITAYGNTGPLAGRPHTDALVQATTGLLDTTGERNAAPVVTQFAVVEGIAALFAAAGVQSALRVRARSGIGQRVDVALYDCAISTLTTFLPLHLAGKRVSRCGNAHVLAVPWNAYRAHDGWLIICTTTDDQWVRLCAVMETPELAIDPRYREPKGRIEHRADVDATVQNWAGSRTIAECVALLQKRDIASGPVIVADEAMSDENLKYRNAFALEHDPLTGRDIMVPRRVIAMNGWQSAAPTRIPLPDADRAGLSTPKAAPMFAHDLAPIGERARPLDGVRILEIGQFTTVPIATRFLAALGADVIKIEPPSGDGSRPYVPRQDGESIYFILSNSDKQSLCLDLRKEADQVIFKALVAESDVLIENLKPGSLDRLGFGAKVLSEINPRLVYCGVSGFGADSVYPGRPAFDTVIQAMSGVMDLNRAGGIPQKTGISMADIVGGLFGVVGTVHALSLREDGVRPLHVDISMQDTAAWVTQLRPRASDAAASETSVLKCRDGYAVAVLPKTESAPYDLILSLNECSRADAVAKFADRGILAAPVLSVGEAADSHQTSARSLLLRRSDSLNYSRIVLDCPIKLSATPARVERSIGPIGEANDKIKLALASGRRS